VEEKREDSGHFGPYENIIAFGHLCMSPMLLNIKKMTQFKLKKKKKNYNR